ncbi:MAG TPA: hypothetical protein PLP19_04540 [bacterium]|nr:hypothetical protein [bacterium]HPN42738.1 hypothetical protein [bacterium]
MVKIPHSPEEIFTEFTNDVKALFGDDLVAIALYGSGAKGEYVYKKSDINFLVVLTEAGMGKLSAALEFVKKWDKRKVSAPLFLSREYIASSLDSFPIEFLNMKKYHKPVYGEDILAGLEFSREHLRLKCEEQVKGKLLHLREGFLRTFGNRQALETLLAATIPAFASLFTALLEFNNIAVPATKKDTILKAAESFKLDQEIFSRVLAVREKTYKPEKSELIELTVNYIKEIHKLAIIVDAWQ